MEKSPADSAMIHPPYMGLCGTSVINVQNLHLLTFPARMRWADEVVPKLLILKWKMNQGEIMAVLAKGYYGHDNCGLELQVGED